MPTIQRSVMRATPRTFAASLLSIVAVAWTLAASAAPPDLIISEYVEGSSSNKAIELYNGTGADVDLAQYSIELYTNGNATAGNTLDNMTGTLANGSTYVIVNSQANATLAPLGQITSGVTNFNGDDALVLKHNGTVIDSFGQVGFDPGSAWGSGDTSTVNHTLRRKPTVCQGDTNTGDAFDPAVEWDGFAEDTFDGLGSHTMTCGNPTDINVSIADVSHPEGNSGSTAFDFTVHLSQAAASDMTFDITTSDGTASAGSDYTAKAITGATIAAGATDYTFTVLVTGDTDPEPDETFTVTASNFSDANVVTTSAIATGTIVNDDVFNVAIYTIQGNPSTQGADGASPYVGQIVHTSGIVTVLDGGSFYVQTADADADSDTTTSNGIYVFRPSNATPAVVTGDAVAFDATVKEYYGLTELDSVSNLTVTAQNQPLPTAVAFDATTPSTDPNALSCGTTNFECFEGMLISINDGLVTQGSGKSSQHPYDYLYVTASGTRSLREPGLFPGNASSVGDNDSAGHWDGNPEVFEMSPNEFAGVNDDQVPINGGSTFTATGVMGYSFGSYEFYPTSLTITHAAPVPRAVATAFPSTLRVGSFNVERFCDDVDDTVPSGTDPIPPGKELSECSGGTLPTAADYTLKTQRLGDYIATVLNLPDVLAVEEVENISVLTRLADQLNADYPGVHYVAKLIEGNDIGGIDVGYLVNTDRVQIFAVQQLDKDLKWLTPNNNQRAVFDHPPLLLQGIFIGAGQSEPFMVMVNHLKARQNVDKVTSTGTPTAQAREDQEKRFRQAYAAALLVQDLQTSYSARTADFRASLGTAQRSAATGGGIPLLVVGDFNAYQFTDGYVDSVGMIAGTYDFAANLWDPSDLSAWNLQPLTTPFPDTNVVVPPLWNAVTSLPTNEQYSYLFSPNFGAIQGYGVGGGSRKIPVDQVLDHALLNEAARKTFVRMDYGRANQDAASEDESSSTGPIGVSDHDGFVVQLSLDDVIFANGFEANN